MATTTTLDTLHQRILKELYRGKRLLVQTVESNSSGATDVVVADAEYSSASANAYDGIYLYFPDISSGNKVTRVTRGGFTAATGTFTLDPDLGGTPQANDDVYFTWALSMDEIDEAINDVIRTLYLPRYGVLSLVDDPNMEDSGTSEYSVLGGGSIAKSTTATTMLTGTQSLQVTLGGSAGDGVLIDLHNIWGGGAGYESEQISVSLIYTIISAADWEVNLQDGSTILKSVDISDSPLQTWLEVRFVESVDSTTTTLKLEVQSDGTDNSGALYIDSVSVLSDRRPYLRPPSQIVDLNDIEGVFALPLGAPTEMTDVYVPFSRDMDEVTHKNWVDYEAVESQKIYVPRHRHWDRPLWVKYRAAGSTLSQNTGDTNTTNAPEEIVVSGALATLHRTLADRLRNARDRAWHEGRAREWNRTYRHLLNQIGVGKPRVKMLSQNRVSVG